MEKALSLDDKIKLTSGDSAKKYCKLILGKNFLSMGDGPHGITRGENISYPNMCLMACSFDKQLLREYGESLAIDAKENAIDLLLAPSVNLKRNPYCGRNFEYFSEDPCLTAELASEYILGLQENGVGACVKHFACYNQEFDRFSYNSVIREDVFFDLYAKAFEFIIKKAKPLSLMMGYNRVNGEFCSENAFLISALRDRFGFEGLILSDWGGIDYRAKSLKVGNNLDMPGSDAVTHNDILDAINNGELSEKDIDFSVNKVIETIKKSQELKQVKSERHSLKDFVVKSVVLLKNNGVLPLQNSDKIAIVGDNYVTQGGGCAHVTTNKVIQPYEYFCNVLGKKLPYYDYESDFSFLKKGKIIFFASVEDYEDSETYDRDKLTLPSRQVDALKRLYKVNKNIVVALSNGSSLELCDVVENCSALVDFYFAGEAFSEAVFDILFGKCSPSGRLCETIAINSDDIPAVNFYKNNQYEVLYQENAFMGYRYFSSFDKKVLFPFGFGLSYTSFKWSDFVVKNKNGVVCSLKVKNIGDFDGGEVVQIYLKNLSDNSRPKLKLIGFEKVYLNKGEEREINISIDDSFIKEYDMIKKEYRFPNYLAEIVFAQNVQKEIYSSKISFESRKIDRYTTIRELSKSEKGREIVSTRLQKYLSASAYGVTDVPVNFEGGEMQGEKFFREVASSMQLRVLVSLSGGRLSNKMLDELIDELNVELGN